MTALIRNEEHMAAVTKLQADIYFLQARLIERTEQSTATAYRDAERIRALEEENREALKLVRLMYDHHATYIAPSVQTAVDKFLSGKEPQPSKAKPRKEEKPWTVGYFGGTYQAENRTALKTSGFFKTRMECQSHCDALNAPTKENQS